ncbi:MAG: sensor histidine kinase [Verrucomicrobia bacterium]|nr:sensor histidine kinase [Verrucomicrobiota bacterium]
MTGCASNFLCAVAVVLLAGDGLAAVADAPAVPPVGNAAQVRVLSSEQAQLQPAVTLRGVVTYCRHAGTSDFTVQDATGGVWVPEMPLPSGFTPGAEVEITGHAEPGVFGPVVRTQSVRVLGAGTLPVALPVSYEELLAVRLNSQRVELTGVIRSQRVDPEAGLAWLALELASGGGRVTLNVTHEITGHPELVGARVRVRGVCLHSPDPREQQVLLPTLNVHTLEDIAVLSSGVMRPFDLPVVPMNQLLRPTSQTEPDRLVHVHGIVTLLPPEGPLAVQDETRGLRVWLHESPRPHLGEWVDVAGFPEPGGYSPVLRDAEWQLAGPARLPAPFAVEPQAATAHEGSLVTVRGVLAAAARGEDRWTLTLENGPDRFLARIHSTQALPWHLGSELADTGVCEVEVGSWESFVTHRRPQGFSLVARDFDGVTLLKSPSWWSPLRAFAVLGAVLAGMLGVLWIRSRRRLREERRAREMARALFAAVFGERNRMAGEIHDTLAQGFASISIQLEALGDRLGALPDGTRRHLDLARQLVRQCLAEARRAVWALRAKALEEGTLGEALAQIGRQLTEGSPVTFELQSTGTPRPLVAKVENDLLRTGQEALTNAVRHADARHIALVLDYQETAVRLAVTDNGRGLGAGPPGAPNSGFGLAGMRERARAIDAELNLRSTPGTGTTIELIVPHV